MLIDSRFLTLPSYLYRMHVHTTAEFDAGVLRYRQEILFEIGFIEEMRTTCGNKEMPQTFFHNFHNAKIRFIPFDYIPLATLLFAILWHHTRRTVDQYW